MLSWQNNQFVIKKMCYTMSRWDHRKGMCNQDITLWWSQEILIKEIIFTFLVYCTKEEYMTTWAVFPVMSPLLWPCSTITDQKNKSPFLPMAFACMQLHQQVQKLSYNYYFGDHFKGSSSNKIMQFNYLLYKSRIMHSWPSWGVTSPRLLICYQYKVEIWNKFHTDS